MTTFLIALAVGGLLFWLLRWRLQQIQDDEDVTPLEAWRRIEKK